MNYKKILVTLFTILGVYTIPISTMAYTQEDINSAKSIARGKAPLRGSPNPDQDAYLRYYNETLAHLKSVLAMGFEVYTKTLNYAWDIENIPILNTTTISKENFQEVLNDAINLYTYLINNP